MFQFLSKIFGDPNKKEISRLQKIVEKINALEIDLQKLPDEKVAAKTDEFKKRIADGENLNSILPEAFAVVKNVCRRLCGKKFQVLKNEIIWEMVPFDVQILGAIVLHEGKIAEMKTGEGKTLTSILPIYLNSLGGRGVHVVTVNEFLARRDAEWNRPVFDFLGISVGKILHEMDSAARRENYSRDVTFATNNELGFDFLRDSMAPSLEAMVQRELNFAIVDEVDSILIDEARTPLIISQPAEEVTDKYLKYSRLVKNLNSETDFTVDEKAKSAVLTDAGISKMEKLLGVENIFTDAGLVEVRHIEQSLRAQFCFHRDKDYVVDGENRVVIVDEFTGRLMPGRRYSEGLHQAIEAKENVEIRRESKTVATITFQNYFRIYEKLAGMTGTALTEAEEFSKIYKLEVLPIPTHRTIARDDKKDLVFKNENGKFAAIAAEVREKNSKGQPVLIGTISIEKSEKLSNFLQKEKIPHAILNAKFHEKEAEIISKAGEKGAVTIATNMAGRGTDIKLGDGVEKLGGLSIIGSERHESRRIDNQLRGRAGRQGDAGESQFFVSLDDPLMRLFGSARLQSLMNTLKIPDEMPIDSKIVSRSIESAQKKVEGRNFDIRKHLVEFDDVTNKHREIIQKRRLKILKNENLHDEILKILQNVAANLVARNCAGKRVDWDLEKLKTEIKNLSGAEFEIAGEIDSQVNPRDISGVNEHNLNLTELQTAVIEFLTEKLESKKAELPDPEKFSEVEKFVALRAVDALWPDHIDAMAHLRETVSLRGFAQRDPLLEFKSEGFEKFKNLLGEIEFETARTLFAVKIQINETPLPSLPVKNLATNAEKISENFTNEFSGGENKIQKIRAENSNLNSAEKVGRNDPCPCGSGKKFKKCCGK